MSVAYSPDGRRLATGNLDGSVKVWDATSGYPRELLTLGGQSLPLGHVTFSPDGSRLAAAGGDSKAVRVWDATAK
jgi:WD40 repeat protein